MTEYWLKRPAVSQDAAKQTNSVPTLVLLHGFMGSKEDWAALMPQLPANYLCLAPDLPGHGDNPQNDCRPEAVCRQLLQDLQSLGVRHCVLLGYSMGGRVALMLQHWLSQQNAPVLKIEALILESSSLGLAEAERQRRKIWDEDQAQALESQELHVFLSRWYEMPLFASLRQSPAFRAVLKRRLQYNQSLRLARCLRELGTGQMPMHPVPDLPLLYLVGTQDSKYLQLARSLPARVQTEILPGGHNLHLESPAQWLWAVRRFLDLR